MAIVYRKDNILLSSMQTITNPVNCVGVMGKGLALQFKEAYPDVFEIYANMCKKHELNLGQPILITQETKPWILLFPTKYHWKETSRLDKIHEGLMYLRQSFQSWGITSLAIPALGCGLGGLDWNDVKPLMEQYLNWNIPVEIFEPQDN